MKNILKIAAIAVIALSVTACDQVYVKVKPADLVPGAEKCEANGGVERYYLESLSRSKLSFVRVFCKNGVVYSYKVDYKE